MRTPSWWSTWWHNGPSLGVHVGAGILSVATVEPGARRYQLLSSSVDTLPAGAVVPSPIEPNIRDVPAIVDRLKSAVRAQGAREVALSLPDPAVRVAILELAHLPARRAEREAFFRHHMEQLFLNTLGRCRFAYQRLAPLVSGQQRVLVSAIREEILEEYEAVVRAAGLVPAVVDISAFHLHNLYQDQLAAAARSSPSVLFMNMFDQNFTIIILGPEGPRYIRIKAARIGMTDAELMSLITGEVESSLNESEESEGRPEALPRLYLFSDRDLPALAAELSESCQVEMTRLQLNGHVVGRSAGRTMPPANATTEPAALNETVGPPLTDRPAVATALAAAIGRRTGPSSS